MKLRTIFAIVIAFCFGMQLSMAQSRDVGAVEFEIGGGIVSPTERLDFDKNHLGFNAQAELRYNFQELPFDIGLHVDVLNPETCILQHLLNGDDIGMTSTPSKW